MSLSNLSSTPLHTSSWLRAATSQRSEHSPLFIISFNSQFLRLLLLAVPKRSHHGIFGKLIIQDPRGRMSVRSRPLQDLLPQRSRPFQDSLRCICQCTQCRKHTGSFFLATLTVPISATEWQSDSEHKIRDIASPKVSRAASAATVAPFCSGPPTGKISASRLEVWMLCIFLDKGLRTRRVVFP